MISLDNLTWIFRATVIRIVDGDTFSAKFDLGLGIFRDEMKGARNRVRILGYSAPEMHQRPGGLEALRTLELVIPPGTQLWIVSHALDSFGRVLGDVYNHSGDTNLVTLLPTQYRVNRLKQLEALTS
jgi:micrococcal nuclease